MRNPFKRRYRIVTDNYLGYEAQIKYWCWPWWIQMDSTFQAGINTFQSVERAEAYIILVRTKRIVVKYVEL